MKEEYDSKHQLKVYIQMESGWYFGVGFYGYTLGDEDFSTSN